MAFDPYHKWLGIPEKFRPPTYYQLLSLDPEERDPDVIEEAAIRQTTHLRSYQSGPHSELCTRLLNEIAEAKTTLLHPDKRKQYDAKLGKQSPSTSVRAGGASLSVGRSVQSDRKRKRVGSIQKTILARYCVGG